MIAKFQTMLIIIALSGSTSALARSPEPSQIQPLCQSYGGVGHGDSLSDWQRFDVSARIRDAAIKLDSSKKALAAAEALLRTLLGDKQISCELKISADGNIADLRIFKSSGSSTTDQRAIDLVKSASPFWRGGALKNAQCSDKSYLIVFPLLNVKEFSSIK